MKLRNENLAANIQNLDKYTGYRLFSTTRYNGATTNNEYFSGCGFEEQAAWTTNPIYRRSLNRCKKMMARISYKLCKDAMVTSMRILILGSNSGQQSQTVQSHVILEPVYKDTFPTGT